MLEDNMKLSDLNHFSLGTLVGNVNAKSSYTIQGVAYYSTKEGISFVTEEDQRKKRTVEFEEMLSGLDFLSKVSWYWIHDNNTKLVGIIIDGHQANIRLQYKEFDQRIKQDDIPVTPKEFKKICRKNDVKVLFNRIKNDTSE